MASLQQSPSDCQLHRSLPGEYSSGNTRLQSCVTRHGDPRLRAALVELAWRLVRFQPNYKAVLKWRQILAKGALATGATRRKRSWLWPASWLLICGGSKPAGSAEQLGLKIFKQVEGNRKVNTPLIKDFGMCAARYLTCSECAFRVRRLRLGAPLFLFPTDRIDQMVPRLRDG